jgi:hypothetical protein
VTYAKRYVQATTRQAHGGGGSGATRSLVRGRVVVVAVADGS